MNTPSDSTAWVADSGLFIACGRQENAKYTALERFATHNKITFVIPQHVYEEFTVHQHRAHRDRYRSTVQLRVAG